MLDFFRIVTKPLIGIDISPSSIKIMELDIENNRYCLNRYGSALLPKINAVENNLVGMDKVTNTIRELIAKLNITRPYAAIAVSGSSVFSRVIQVKSHFNENHIAEQIEVEADRLMPYPIEEVYYDFEILGSSSKQPDLVDVLLACARIETVNSRLAAVQQAGIKTTIVDLESLAMERVFGLIAQQLPHGGRHQNVALVDIGATTTTLHVFKNLQSIYCRGQTFGGKQLTDEIERRYGMAFKDIVAFKKEGIITGDNEISVLEPFKEIVIQQINRALQIFYSSTEENNIDRLILAGGVAMLNGLVEALQLNTNIPTMIANPFHDMTFKSDIVKHNLEYEASSLLVCCGLALRNFD